MPACPHCSSISTHKDGRDRAKKQRYRCSTCRRSFTDRTGTPFTNHRWPRDVIIMAVRWYFCYRLSTANVRNLLAERGLDVSRRTVADWAQKFGILLVEAGRRHAKPLGRRWFVDETYLRVGKTWAYLFNIARGIDERPVDPNRLRKSIGAETTFERDITSHDALVAELPPVAEMLASRLSRAGVQAGNVILKENHVVRADHAQNAVVTTDRRRSDPEPYSRPHQQYQARHITRR